MKALGTSETSTDDYPAWLSASTVRLGSLKWLCDLYILGRIGMELSTYGASIRATNIMKTVRPTRQVQELRSLNQEDTKMTTMKVIPSPVVRYYYYYYSANFWKCILFQEKRQKSHWTWDWWKPPDPAAWRWKVLSYILECLQQPPQAGSVSPSDAPKATRRPTPFKSFGLLMAFLLSSLSVVRVF